MQSRLGWAASVLLVYACGGSSFEGFEDPPNAGSTGFAGSVGSSGRQSVGGAGASNSAGAPAAGGTSVSGRSGSGGSGGESSPSGGNMNEAGAHAGEANEAGTHSGGRAGSSFGGAQSGGSAGVGGDPSGGSSGAPSGGTASGGTAGGGAAGVGGGPDAHCPPRLPTTMKACMPEGLQCTYSGINGCLCKQIDRYTCTPVDPKCSMLTTSFAAPPAEGGTGNRLVPVAHQTCTCSAAGWQCAIVAP